MQYQTLGLFIDGRWIHDADLPHSDVVDPATGQVIARLPHATPTLVGAALAAAQRGFDTWRATALSARCRILQRALDLMTERASEIAWTMTLEQGKPLAEARGEVLRSVALLQWDIEESRRAYGHVIPAEPGFRNTTRRLPIGPVAAFSPWNFPASIVARKLAALAAGCSVILKAAEETPGTACAMVQCFADAGLPPGVLNLVFGNPAAISEQLIRSDTVRAVTLTGSVPVGKKVAALAALHMKPAVMELGGHAPVIVCEDADPVRAATQCVPAKFRNAGQICTAPTRFIVHRARYQAFLDAFVAGVQKIKVGHGTADGTTMGPLANPRRLADMARLVDTTVSAGARLVHGGHRIGTEGCFFEPTVLADVPLDAAAMHEEPFGPVALVVPFDTLDEAIAIANSTPLGLASYAFTDVASSAERLMNEVETGIMAINHMAGSIPEGAFGGVKDSGFGREGGAEGLHAFLVTKFVSQKHA